jgi:hypothetical protein
VGKGNLSALFKKNWVTAQPEHKPAKNTERAAKRAISLKRTTI